MSSLGRLRLQQQLGFSPRALFAKVQEHLALVE